MRSRDDIPLLIQEKDIRTALKEGVRSRETSETTANNDDLSHWIQDN